MLSITKNKTKSSVTSRRPETALLRQPVLVYNSRIDSLLKEIKVEVKLVTVSNLSADWSQFMDDLNTRMFDKISF
ncbi:MAG: hypothetical protein ACI840_002172 [Ulvibacter sp.]|jgi:hypothetical protein